MDALTNTFYELWFKTEFLQAKGLAFQTLFATIMSKAHPNDFIACCPWGAIGDRKNDGYLRSERILFQVYAPNELRASRTINKIREDFSQALPHWKTHFDTWVFVHNATNGLPPDVIKTLLELERDHAPLKVRTWGYEELLLRFRRMSAGALVSLYGAPPARDAMSRMLTGEGQPPASTALTIIIPVYNEAEHIPALVQGLRGAGFTDRCDILICDDASTDNSVALLQDAHDEVPRITLLRSAVNTRKVGAIERMTRMVRTPFVLTLDADCMLLEVHRNALANLLDKMHKEQIAASYFRILPDDRDWLGRLQKLDYTIFTDTLRDFFNIPVCLIGQGVVWNTQRFLDVLADHSKQYHGDDLENTLIALTKGMRVYWERDSIVLTTVPKASVLSLVRQRALSWEYGMFRVLLSKRALFLGGNSGAFYTNLLWMDLVAHPFRLLAIPMLLGALLFRLLGESVLGPAVMDATFYSLQFSFAVGTSAIKTILIASIVTSALCVRGRPLAVLKWAVFNCFYLSSPFVFFLYYPLITATTVGAEDVFGAAIYWLGLGLVLTYTWWILLTLFLLWRSSLPRHKKKALLVSVLLAPAYYFVLLTVCKTIGICKALKARVLGDEQCGAPATSA